MAHLKGKILICREKSSKMKSCALKEGYFNLTNDTFLKNH